MENNVEESLSQDLPQALKGSKLRAPSPGCCARTHGRGVYACALDEVHLMESQFSNELFLITSLT